MRDLHCAMPQRQCHSGQWSLLCIAPAHLAGRHASVVLCVPIDPPVPKWIFERRRGPLVTSCEGSLHYRSCLVDVPPASHAHRHLNCSHGDVQYVPACCAIATFALRQQMKELQDETSFKDKQLKSSEVRPRVTVKPADVMLFSKSCFSARWLSMRGPQKEILACLHIHVSSCYCFPRHIHHEWGPGILVTCAARARTPVLHDGSFEHHRLQIAALITIQACVLASAHAR